MRGALRERGPRFRVGTTRGKAKEMEGLEEEIMDVFFWQLGAEAVVHARSHSWIESTRGKGK